MLRTLESEEFHALLAIHSRSRALAARAEGAPKKKASLLFFLELLKYAPEP